MATTKTSRVTWVWGDKTKGIAVVRSARKSKGKYSWDIHHVKDGTTVHMARDYSTKAEAIREAKSYSQYAKKHPRSGFFSFGS